MREKFYRDNNIMSEVLKSLESLYTQERYAEALEILEKSQDLIPLGQYHYNLGTLYLKMDQIGPARHHLEQALNEGFVHSAIFNNLQFLQQKLNVIDLSFSQEPWDRFYHYVLSTPQEIYLFVFLIAVLGIILTFKWRPSFKWFIATPMIIVSLAVSYLYFGIAQKKSVAVSLVDIEVLEGPSGLYQKKFSLPAGSKVLIGRDADEWFYIERPLHFSGWVRKVDLGVVGSLE